jgi:hypothetical protein
MLPERYPHDTARARSNWETVRVGVLGGTAKEAQQTKKQVCVVKIQDRVVHSSQSRKLGKQLLGISPSAGYLNIDRTLCGAMQHVLAGHSDEVQRAALSLTDRQYGGRSALHSAVINCHSRTVELLLRKGATLTGLDENGNNPLHSAAASTNCNTPHTGGSKVFTLLANAAGAPALCALDGSGKTPMTCKGRSELHSAVSIDLEGYLNGRSYLPSWVVGFGFAFFVLWVLLLVFTPSKGSVGANSNGQGGVAPSFIPIAFGGPPVFFLFWLRASWMLRALALARYLQQSVGQIKRGMDKQHPDCYKFKQLGWHPPLSPPLWGWAALEDAMGDEAQLSSAWHSWHPPLAPPPWRGAALGHATGAALGGEAGSGAVSAVLEHCNEHVSQDVTQLRVQDMVCGGGGESTGVQ